MVKCITDYLDKTAKIYPDKVAFADINVEMTFKQLREEAHCVAGALIRCEVFKQPIIVFMEKTPQCIAAFMGVAYSGNFYTPLDTSMPSERIDKIIDVLEPAVIISDKKNEMMARDIASADVKVLLYDDIVVQGYALEVIENVNARIIDTDVLYVLFTSGSTGMPKGVIVSHRSVIDHAEWASNSLGFNSSNIFANQSPFYFDHSILEIFQTIRNGATLYIVPQNMFSFPKKLMSYLAERCVDSLIWVPSALCYLANLGAVEKYFLPKLKNVMFGGEVMPVPQYKIWKKKYPDVQFVNLYGPTEATDDSTYYVIKRDLADNESIPIGIACSNTDVFLLDEYDHLICESYKEGEICIRGTGVAYGYYRNQEKTREVFVQNPLHNLYEEKIYRTGDIAMYNEFNEIIYVGRRDFQIKHMGRRIELGEIENAALTIPLIERVCCVYDSPRKQIIMYYVGDVDSESILLHLRGRIPDYMAPARVIKLKEMPLNLNGKIDRKKLKGELANEIER